MKKFATIIFAFILTVSLVSISYGARIEDFENVSFEDNHFYDETGSLKLYEASEGKTFDTVQEALAYAEYAKLHPSYITSFDLFDKVIAEMPDSIPILYNRYGGKIRFLKTPFYVPWETTQYNGYCYYTYPRYGDIDLRIEDDGLYPYYQLVSAGRNFAHEIGHFVRLVTKDRWTTEDKGSMNELVKIYKESGYVDYLLTYEGYSPSSIEDECFASCYSTLYGNFNRISEVMFSERVIRFMDHINEIASQMAAGS